MLAATIHMEITALRWAAPLHGRTLNSWFAVVVGRRIVEPHSLSMMGIDILAHMQKRPQLWALRALGLGMGPLTRGTYPSPSKVWNKPIIGGVVCVHCIAACFAATATSTHYH